MNKQEMFDRAVEYFREARGQAGAPTCEGDFECMYEDPQGKRCVIGSMMPAHHPALSMGFMGGVANLRPEFPDLAWLLNEDTMDLAEWLQHTHDDPDNWDANGFFEGWDRIQALAEDYGLEYLNVPTEEVSIVTT